MMTDRIAGEAATPWRQPLDGAQGEATRRVLLISYAFPPVGGAGVQRAVKFVKYLPQQGWCASVLTVSNASVPARDESLLRDVPPGTTIARARTLEPSYALKSAVSANQGAARVGGLRGLAKHFVRQGANMLLQPDAQVLWAPYALRAGKRLLAQEPHDVILVSAPPFSSFLLGAALHRWSGLPLVLDYRDEWDLSHAYLENKQAGWVARRLQGWMQARVLRAASAVIATTRSSAAALEMLRDRAGSRADVTCIYNGYDPDDLAGPAATPTVGPRRFRVAYVGTLWNLTSVQPLVEGVRLLCGQAPELAGHLELAFVGRRTPEQEGMLASLARLPCRCVERPYLPHDEAVALVRDSDLLCVLLSDLAGAGRVVPAKIFEYMATKRPILAVAPRGELWELLRDYPGAATHRPTDVAGIAGSLARQIGQWARTPGLRCCEFDASRYSRPHETGELARLLDTVRAGRSSVRMAASWKAGVPTPAW